jgi:hypothetical protein
MGQFKNIKENLLMITISEQYDKSRDNRSKEEIEECVEFVRLELYNRDLACGPDAIRKRLDKYYHVKPLPSAKTIARILSRRCLTHNRTGFYPEDDLV